MKMMRDEIQTREKRITEMESRMRALDLCSGLQCRSCE